MHLLGGCTQEAAMQGATQTTVGLGELSACSRRCAGCHSVCKRLYMVARQDREMSCSLQQQVVAAAFRIRRRLSVKVGHVSAAGGALDWWRHRQCLSLMMLQRQQALDMTPCSHTAVAADSSHGCQQSACAA